MTKYLRFAITSIACLLPSLVFADEPKAPATVKGS
jgi:hypothetical protein